MARYDIGDLVRVSAAFTDENGDAIDPGGVFCQYMGPDEVVVELEYGVDGGLAKDATGCYHVDIDIDQSGRWYYRFYSTGEGKAAEERSFDVQASMFSDA